MNLKSKKFYFLLFPFVIYFLIGSYLSLTNGLTSDEWIEQKNWEINIASVIDFISTGKYPELINYRDKYHGIGFHYISQPIQYLIKNYITNINEVSKFGGLLLSKHVVVFFTFCLSGLFFYKIINKIVNNKIYALLSTGIYLLYPYLFGHAHFNPKDIPFLSFWLINTYFSLKIFEEIYLEKEINFKYIVLVSFLSAYLISIRVVGILIFFQYLVTLIIFLNLKKINFINFLIKNYKIISIFILVFLPSIIILNPIFWHNPFEILNSIKWMGKYPQNICTLTNGSCMKANNLPSSYYFIWFFYKLPILILFGYLIFPLVESKIFKDKIISIYYGTITIIVPSIIFIFIIKNVALYDELRHLLFIFPLIFITAFTNLFFFIKKKILYIIGIGMIIFFVLENYNTNPYQYTWLNSFTKSKNIEKNFEIDYWGLSNKNLQNKILEFSEKNNVPKSTCVFGDFYVKEFLETKGFNCFKLYSQIDDPNKRPLFAYKNLRTVKRSDPKNCDLIWDEKYKYSFYHKEISAGTLWYCY